MRKLAVLAAALLLSCARGGVEHAKPYGTVFEVEGVFRIGKPGDGWKLHRNRRQGNRYLLDYRRTDADVDLRVTVHPLDETSRRMPLPSLAEGVVMNYGRGREIETELRGLQRADFGAHEGLVVHFTRRWKPNMERRMVQCFVRTSESLVMLTYIAPPALYERYAPDFAHALESFAVLLPPEKPALGIPMPEDLPQKAADTAGGPLPVTTPPPPSGREPPGPGAGPGP